MNILFVNDFPFSDAGGVGRVTQTLAGQFMDLGHKVLYLALTGGQDFVAAGIKQSFLADEKGGTRGKIRFVTDFFKKYSFDLIINQGGTKRNVLGIITKANKGKIPVFSVHHNCVNGIIDNYQQIISEGYRTNLFASLIKNPFIFFFIKAYFRVNYARDFRRTINCSERLVLLSERFIPEVLNLLHTKKNDKLTAIPNPAPFDPIHDIDKKENRILFVGRADIRQKRIDLLLRIWEILYKKHEDWSFDIVGDGPDLQRIKLDALNMQLPGIYFHGNKDPRAYLEKAKLFCMTSAFEGFGMVLVEAQAYGVVPFAFNTFPNLEDIIEDKKNGVIIPPFDIIRYASEMSDLMSDEKRRFSMARNAQNAVSRYDRNAIALKWIELRNELKSSVR